MTTQQTKACTFVLILNSIFLAIAISSSSVSAQPQVIVNEETIVITFSEGSEITLERNKGKGITRIEKLRTNNRDILMNPTGMETPQIIFEMLSDDSTGGITDWPAYLLERQANGNKWPQRGGREVYPLELGQAEFVSCRIDGDSVIVQTKVSNGDDSGDIEWIFVPVNMNIGESIYSGVGWKVRVTGLEKAAWLHIIEPAVERIGDWVFAQLWGNWIEHSTGHSSPLAIPKSWYFGESQPYFFAGGATGAALSFFSKPVCAQIAVDGEAQRHILQSRIPLGKGPVRETPLKYWLWSTMSLPTKWAALNEWTTVFDFTSDLYGRMSLLAQKPTPLLPTIEMDWPDEEYWNNYFAQGKPSLEDSWFYKFSQKELLEAYENGFRVIRVVAWESDADYPSSRMLPGSNGQSSGNAPWRLNISEALGGEEALKILVDKAHELGIKIVLWTSPGHLSNSSPLLIQYPEWLLWKHDGTPQDSDWGDITGVSLQSGYYDYALARYRQVRSATNVDGFLVDSHLTFGVYADYSQRQPSPQFDQNLATQLEWRKMGYTDIIEEGCGMFGSVSSAGYPGPDAFELDFPGDMRDEAQRIVDRFKGKEYGLYNYMAETIFTVEAYYRALASKGHISLHLFVWLHRLSNDNLEKMKQTNTDYLQVMDKMQRRKLIGSRETWQGVEWTSNASSEVVLFAFESFNYTVASGESIHDVTTGTMVDGTSGLKTQAMHTYIIGGTATGVLDSQSQLEFELQQNYLVGFIFGGQDCELNNLTICVFSSTVFARVSSMHFICLINSRHSDLTGTNS